MEETSAAMRRVGIWDLPLNGVENHSPFRSVEGSKVRSDQGPFTVDAVGKGTDLEIIITSELKWTGQFVAAT